VGTVNQNVNGINRKSVTQIRQRHGSPQGGHFTPWKLESVKNRKKIGKNVDFAPLEMVCPSLEADVVGKWATLGPFPVDDFFLVIRFILPAKRAPSPKIVLCPALSGKSNVGRRSFAPPGKVSADAHACLLPSWSPCPRTVLRLISFYLRSRRGIIDRN